MLGLLKCLIENCEAASLVELGGRLRKCIRLVQSPLEIIILNSCLY
jgi:hypothetical protein